MRTKFDIYVFCYYIRVFYYTQLNISSIKVSEDNWVSEWVSEWLLFNTNEQFFSHTMTRTSYIQWYDDDDDVHFVLQQHA